MELARLSTQQPSILAGNWVGVSGSVMPGWYEFFRLSCLEGMWLWVKAVLIPFWGFRCTTHFRTYFSGWIGMFTGGYDLDFDPWPCQTWSTQPFSPSDGVATGDSRSPSSALLPFLFWLGGFLYSSRLQRKGCPHSNLSNLEGLGFLGFTSEVPKPLAVADGSFLTH